MIAEHDRLGAMQKLTAEEAACLADEKSRRDRFQRELRSQLQTAIEGGIAFFQGNPHDASALGGSFAEALHALMDRAVPLLYPKLEIGSLQLDGDEADTFLTAANLNGLPQLFHAEKPERRLVTTQGGRSVPNLGSEL